MHWIIQTNLYSEATHSDLVRILAALKEVGASVEEVKLVPFFGIFQPEPKCPPGPIVALGSTTMMKVAQARGWTPGVFFNEQFRFEAWLTGYGAENLFNGDALVAPFKDVEITEDTFIRPCEDLKAFSGFVTSPADWADWKTRVLTGEKSSDFTSLNAETMIVAAKPRPILREYRVFIVGGRVVTGSMYRNGEKLDRQLLTDSEIIDFAQTMALRWSPADAYALDIAVCENGEPRVLEINCFNSAGTYEADLVMLYGAIERLFSQ